MVVSICRLDASIFRGDKDCHTEALAISRIHRCTSLFPGDLCLPGFGVDPNAGMFKLAGEFPAVGRDSLVSALGRTKGPFQFGVVDQHAVRQCPAQLSVDWLMS